MRQIKGILILAIILSLFTGCSSINNENVTNFSENSRGLLIYPLNSDYVKKPVIITDRITKDRILNIISSKQIYSPLFMMDSCNTSVENYYVELSDRESKFFFNNADSFKGKKENEIYYWGEFSFKYSYISGAFNDLKTFTFSKEKSLIYSICLNRKIMRIEGLVMSTGSTTDE